MSDRPRFTLTIEATADPIARHHGTDRAAEYRLKLLLKRMLRDLGFRCVGCGPTDDVPACTGAGAPSIRGAD